VWGSVQPTQSVERTCETQRAGTSQVRLRPLIRGDFGLRRAESREQREYLAAVPSPPSTLSTSTVRLDPEGI
jgi:hypothetical protein